jgi:catalase (peroxidase I)
MGGVHKAISPNLTDKEFAPFDDTPGVFDNHVFKRSLEGNCALQVDCEIARDPDTRPFVELFASDQEAFFKQYAESFPKMIDLTTSNLDPPMDIKVPVHENLFKEGTVGSEAAKPPTSSSSPVNAFSFLTLVYLLWTAF